MKLHPIQNTFEAGELSPRMLGRSDTDTYSKGLLSGKNMVIDVRGPARSRSGSEHQLTLTADCARLEVFQVEANSYFNMLFTPLRLDIGSPTGSVATSNYIKNGYFLQGDDDWTIAVNAGGSVLFLPGVCDMKGGDNPASYAILRQPINITNGDEDQALIISSLGTDPFDILVGTTAGGNDILNTTSTQQRFEAIFNPGIAGPITIWLDIVVNTDANKFITSVVMPDDDTALGFDTPWTCQHIPELYFVPSPGGEAIYILHRTVQPHKLIYDDETSVFDLTLVTFEDPDIGGTPEDPLWIRPLEWGPGLFDSWPGVGAIYQGRLWLMSTRNELQSIWGSRSGSFEKFYVADDDNVVADDAILNLPLESYGRIQWAFGSKRLVLGTINAEYILSSSDGLLRPTDIQPVKQSAYGSKQIRPIQVDDQIIYVSADGRKVRAMSYLERADNWISEELTLLSEHLTKASIIDMAWAPNPDALLVCVLANGSTVTCTYEHNVNIIAWTPNETQGFVSSMAIGHVLGFSVGNMLVKRLSTEFSYETVRPIEFSQPLDSHIHKSDVIPFDFVEGLEHLEGLEVQVVADGVMHPVRTVTGGQIDLNKEYLSVRVGLGFAKRLITLPFDKGSATGSGASHFKKFNKILVRLLDSAKPKINGDRPPTRNPSTPMNTPELPRTEDVEVINLGWDREALITIEQDLPLSLTVVAIFGELGQESF